MYQIKNLFDKSPIAISTAIVAVVNVLLITDVVDLTADAVSALNVALIAVLGLFVSNKTANKAVLDELVDPPAE